MLLVVPLLGFMFIAPAITVWWDLRRDRRRFGLDALSRPVRYAADGEPYREGLPPPPASGIGAGQVAGVDGVDGVDVDVPLKGQRVRAGAALGPTADPEASATGR
ncbi:hypothetical protein BL253_23180 [Pseudofrankia asymbiotica]|uniref:Uncharacterized protein n=1 Tax=Pseudofrankia asymbiotica TaxID=1834516 RepID=A0A1V2I722_9ACTN|nr:hypothetical protein BL253_23180 [Pseudofrankia asymbiotica]